MYESQCDGSCSVDGFCEVNNLDLPVGEKEISCICPLDHFGPGCNLQYDQCDENSCLNNGICFLTSDQSGEEPFVCNCSERFEGKRCEVEKLSILVHLNMTRALSACPTVVQLYNHMNSFLSDLDQSVPAVFHYHHICRNHTERFCFYDETYFCICQGDHKRVHCFTHDNQLDHCDECLAGGKCLQGNPNDVNDFTCFCPSCYQGHRCQFNYQAFGFTLDSLLIDQSKEVKIVYVCLAALIFVIGIVTNLYSLMTFIRPTPRKFGVGYYLLVVTCLNQISLFFLFFKLIEITLGSVGIGSCRAVSYSLSVFTRSTYWLTSWIICYTVIKDLSTTSLICVTNFDTVLISTYNRVSTLLHYICPFIIQIISISLLIVLATRSRSKTAGEKTRFVQILKKQFLSQKELYVTPMIFIVCALPQLILTFSFACSQLSDFQRHALLVSYILSFMPQVLGFILYVIPSSTYMKEFSDTMLAKKCFKWMLGK